MMSNLDARYEASEKVRKALIERVGALSVDAQNKRPNAKSFTPLEMLMHMVLVERMYPPLRMAEPKPAKPNFIYRIIVGKMKNPKRVGTMKELEPKGPLTFEGVVKDWDQIRVELKPMLMDSSVVFKHPLFGRMNGEHTLDLVDAHCTYHQILFPQ
jgi:hypothetical protein